MAGAYALSAAGITLANAATTLLFINPAASPNLDLGFQRFWVGQSNNMASAQQRVQLNTQVTAFPGTLTSTTPAKLSIVDGASIIAGGASGAAGTCGVANASTTEGAGAKTVIWSDVFNVVNGWLLVTTPNESIEMGAGAASGLGLHLPVAATTLTNWAFGMTWIES